MNENNKKENDDFLLPEKIKNKKFNSSIISPKKIISKNNIKNKKGVFQIQKKPNALFQNIFNSKIIKCENSPEKKLRTNEIYSLKLFQKNLSNNSNYIKTKKQKKSQKYSNNSSIVNKDNILNLKEEEINNDKINEGNKKININKK